MYVAHSFPLLEHLCDSELENNDGSLVVRLDNDFSVAEPPDVIGSDLGAVMLSIVAFLGHDMRKDVLALEAANQQTLYYFTAGPSLGDCLFTGYPNRGEPR